MLFQRTVTIPAATLVTAEHVETIDLAPGTGVKVRVEFPPGCGELAGVMLKRGIHQVWPITPGEYASWDGGAVESAEEIRLTEEPFELSIHAVNYDVLNPHTVTIAISVLAGGGPPAASPTQRIRSALGLG